MFNVKEKFLRYAAVDTQSEEGVKTVPSTEKQFALAQILADELRSMGASDVKLDSHCYVYATIPHTGQKSSPTIGFIAHMDTSCAVSGENVKAVITPDYDGNDIIMNSELGYTLSPSAYPELLDYVGHEIICTDGTTLLGADDKAGVAEIMALAEHLLTHPEIPHCTVKICFTPDEEVGNGVDFFDVEGFGADFAYTLDGGHVGTFNFENFNAANAHVSVRGASFHPGHAKGKMLNAALVAMELQSLLPPFENPAATEGYEGFYHLDNMTACCDSAAMFYIIRDHDRDIFEKRKAFFLEAGEFINRKYGEGTVSIELSDSYYNMKSQIDQSLIDLALDAMRELSIKPVVEPIRGGTDGARLSYMGLPCPNLCTGGHNFHSRYEFISTQAMEKCTELTLKIVELCSK